MKGLKRVTVMHLLESDVVKFIRKKQSNREREDTLRHLSECPECTSLVAAVSSLEGNPGDIPVLDAHVFEEAVRSPWRKKSIVQRLFRWEARPALAGLALMILFFLAGENRTPPLERFRSDENTVTRFHLLPSEGSVLTGAAPVFRWGSVPGADGYHLVIYASTGVEVWRTTTPDTSAALSSSAGLSPHTGYFWCVEAIMPDTRILRSELQTFLYEPAGPH